MAWTALEWRKKEQSWINPAQGTITSSFGERTNPVLGVKEFHNGIDIAMPMGTQVMAVKEGMVTRIRNSATYGLVLEYETVDGHEVMYAHLSDVSVVVGEHIAQGQAVALSGNSGLSTGPHLHYSVWKGEALLDPMKLVTLHYTQDVVTEYRARGGMI